MFTGPLVGVDFGGSLIKVASCTYENGLGCFVLKKFDTERYLEALSYIGSLFLKAEGSNDDIETSLRTSTLYATGGGAYKYANEFKQLYPHIDMRKYDEMECLIKGLDFVTTCIPDESFTYNNTESYPVEYVPIDQVSQVQYPCLLVNIGSGVSMIKVTDASTYERISGTSFGGGTFWGLMSLLSPCESFDDALHMAELGNNKSVDLLVGDIYGADYAKMGLSRDIIASSFGKAFKVSPEERVKSFLGSAQGQCDMSRSLLFLMSNTIGQLAYLNAQLHRLKRIYFSGFFIRGHAMTMKTLFYAIQFWSKGEMKPYFLKHEGYLGAIGALYQSQENCIKSLSQNYTFKYTQDSQNTHSTTNHILFDELIHFIPH